MSGSRKILLAGSWQWEIYEHALAAGFRCNGWQVVPFKLENHLSRSQICRFQVRLKIGREINSLNRAFLNVVKDEKPDVVFLNLVDLVYRNTLQNLKRSNSKIVLVTYHNDNPFVGLANRFRWRHYLSSLDLADITLVYRPKNIEDAKRWGAKNIYILPPYYLTYRDRPYFKSKGSYLSDVIFIGHYENDGRDEIIDHLIKNGVNVRIYGTKWNEVADKYSWLTANDIKMVRGDEYSRLLSGAKIALVFLSKRNDDVWTRRCFEIPACGTLMMAPRTKELELFFESGREAIFYDSKSDLLEKIKHYLKHDGERERIAEAGMKRCVECEHNEIGRVKQLINIISQINPNQMS